MTRGVPTRYAASPLKQHLEQGNEPPPVWPHAEGLVRGYSFAPLHKNVPKAALADPQLYELLVLVDALRDGQARERKLAITQLSKRLEKDCFKANLVQATRDIPYTYKGESTTIPQVTGDFCPGCGEVVLDAKESARTSARMLDFNKQVNAFTVDPEFIISVRKKLSLDQKEAAEIFGGGINAFSRYENGKTKPPVALVKLLRVLERHPELLAEVRVLYPNSMAAHPARLNP